MKAEELLQSLGINSYTKRHLHIINEFIANKGTEKMERPNRKDYINKKTKVQLIADLERYIDFLTKENEQLNILRVTNCDLKTVEL